MSAHFLRRKTALSAMALSAALAVLAGCANSPMTPDSATMASADGPDTQGPDFPRQDDDAGRGREVFRFETFGNEGF